MSDDPIGDYIEKMGISAVDPKEIINDMLVHARNLAVRLEVAARLLEVSQKQSEPEPNQAAEVFTTEPVCMQEIGPVS